MLGASQLQQRVTCFRLRVTNIDTGKDYETISLHELLTCERTFVPKDQASLTLCSIYNKHDARSHKAQEQHGRFVMHAIDLDSGNLQGAAVVAAVQSFTGDVMMRVYSSSSATKDARKWRVIIPAAADMPHDEWHSVSVALNRHIEKITGTRPDRALEGAGQGNYLPNTAPRNDGIEPLAADKLIEGPLFGWRECPGADGVLQVMAEEDERQREYEQRAAEARRRMAQMRAKPDSEKSVIEQFNGSNDLEQVLTACGYKRGPRGGWRSPQQSTDSFATKIFDEPAGQYWVSKSASDFAAGIGSQTRDGASCFGDAFDAWCFYTHGNDRTAAIKDAADTLGIKPPASDIDRLADRIRANQLAQQQAAPAAPAAEVEFPDDGETQEPASETPAKFEEDDPTTAERTLPFVQACDLPTWEAPHELVEGMLMQGGMTVIYGDSNTGKSFLTLDMVAHISLGKRWMGRQVSQCAVVYLAAESPRSIVDRARALEQHLDERLEQLFIVNCPIDLYDENGDTLAVVNTIAKIQRTYGVKVGCVVADTLARVMGGGDENKAQDMGVVIQHIDLIRAATGSQFILIHHTGKDKTNGARGSSSLRAATDTEIEVSDREDGSPKEAKVTKQRDLPGKNTSVGFDLAIVQLGAGIFGNVFTTCVVEERAPQKPDKERELSSVQRDVLDFIRGNAPSVRRLPIIEHMRGIRPTVNESSITRALDKLQKLDLVTKTLGMYAPLGVDNFGIERQSAGREF